MSLSYPVTWQPRTLGHTALDQLGRITGTRFATAEAYRAWRRSTPNPKTTLGYWEGTLERVGPEARRVRLSALLRDDAELFLKVLLAQRDGNTHQFWWEERDVVGVVRARLGPSGLLRLLRRQGGWTELADPDRFDRFAGWVLDHEAALFDDSDARDLLALWEQHGQSFLRGETQAKLALTTARRNPAERGRIAESSIGYMRQFRERVAEDLVVHDLEPSFSRVERLFRDGDAGDGRIRGPRRHPGGTRPSRPTGALAPQAVLAGAPDFTTSEAGEVAGIRSASMAMGAPDLAPACARMHVAGGKGRAASDDEQLRAHKAQADCIASLPALQAWLRAMR